MLNLISRYSPDNAKNDILSGLTVALALVLGAVVLLW